MDKVLWKLTPQDFLVTLETKHRTLSPFWSPGRSDAGSLCLQVQMTTGFLHSLFNPTAAANG